jgi:hypothetical protein
VKPPLPVIPGSRSDRDLGIVTRFTETARRSRDCLSAAGTLRTIGCVVPTRRDGRPAMMSITRRILGLLPLAALSVAASPAAHASSTARILETQPSSQATLGHQESFWVRIEYDTDEAISLWARPYRNGIQIRKTMTNASLSYTGVGEALGWFALTGPGEVDEVRIFAGGGKPFREWELARQPVQLRWTEATPSEQARAPWVTDLLATEQARYREDARRRASEPVSAADVTLFSGFMLAVVALFVAGLAVPLWSVWKWRGAWRIAAAVPATVMVFVVLRIIVDTARDPTSHNLWPFEILQFAFVALVIVGALKLARRVAGVQE